MRKLLGKIKKATFGTNHAFWFARDLGAPLAPHGIVVEPGAVSVDFNSFQAVVAWLKKEAAGYPWIYNKQEIDCARKHAHLFPAIRYRGEIVGYAKIAFKKAFVQDYEGDIALQDDEAFIYDTFILPEFQKRRIATKLLSEALCYLNKTKISFVYCHIPGWNKASEKLYRNLGFQKIAHVRYMRILRFRFFSNNPDKVKRKSRIFCLRNF